MKIGFRVVLLFVFVTVFASSVTFAQSSSDRAALLKEIESLRDKLKTNEEAFLSPTSQDLAAHAEFLGQPNTGLIRLLPREEYDGKNKLTIRGGGAYYSFTRLTQEYGYGSDIELSMGRLSVGFAGADYGAIVRIGSVSLNDVNLEDPRLRFLSTYEPPSDEPQARSEARRFSYGVKEGVRSIKETRHWRPTLRTFCER
jgi:hypothetical protein